MKMDPIIRKPAAAGRIAVMDLVWKKKQGLVFVNIQIPSVLIDMESSPAYHNEYAGVYAPPLVQETVVADEVSAGEKFCGTGSPGSII